MCEDCGYPGRCECEECDQILVLRVIDSDGNTQDKLVCRVCHCEVRVH